MLTMSTQILKLTQNQERFVAKFQYMIDMYYSVKKMREEMLRTHQAIIEAQMMCTEQRREP